MSSTSYGWEPVLGTELTANTTVAGTQLDPAIASNAAGTLYLTAWTSVSPDEGVMGRFSTATARLRQMNSPSAHRHRVASTR